MSKLIMSMSGTRGVIGDTLSPQIALKTAQAFGSYIGKGPIILGGDTRVSYEMVKGAVISGLTSVGTDVIDIGKVPTPTVQQLIKTHQAKGGIVITASHNPIQWNGLKLMNEQGSFLSPEEYDNFKSIYDQDSYPLATWDTIGSYTTDPKALHTHVDLILNAIDTSSIQNSGLKVLIDGNNSVGALADPILLDRLGITYKILNDTPDGRFTHDPEPLKQNLDQIITELQNGDYDIGFVQDADGDRLVILDENGRFIGEDYSLAFCIDYILSQNTTPTPNVVVNLSTSQVIEKVASQYGATVHYTKIGETNVTQGIIEHNAIVGGEGNGGVIYPTVGWGRDSLTGIVIALKHLAEAKKTVSQIVSNYPQYVLLREKISINSRDDVNPYLEKVKSVFNDAKIDTQDGIKASYPNSWIQIRPSNTEPIMRIFIEAPNKEEAQALFNRLNEG